MKITTTSSYVAPEQERFHTITVAQLRAEVEKAGPIFGQVIVGESRLTVQLVKQDFLLELSDWDADDTVEINRDASGLWIY